MKIGRIFLILGAVIIVTDNASGDSSKNSRRDVDLKSADGTILSRAFFAAAKSGPAVLLFHQDHGTRKSWEGVAAQLAGAGINAP
jgi:hypothetical protein